MSRTSLPGLGPVSPYLARSDLAVSFADPAGEDEPLAWVNAAFCRLVGYPAERCVGRNCRFLQGEGTDADSVARVREGIDSRRFRLSPLVNYRANGERFTNGLLVGPVGDAEGRTLLLFGMQWDIDATLERRRRRANAHAWEAPAQDIRLRHFERLIGYVVDASLERDAAASPISLIERLVAISRPQQYPPHEQLPNWTRANSLLSYLVEPYGASVSGELGLDGRAEILAVDVAHPIALAVHEVYSALGRHTEAVDRPAIPDVSCSTVSEGGEPLFELVWKAAWPEASGAGGEGRSGITREGLAVVTDVAALVGGHFETTLSDTGLEAVLRLPNRLHEIEPTDGRVS